MGAPSGSPESRAISSWPPAPRGSGGAVPRRGGMRPPLGTWWPLLWQPLLARLPTGGVHGDEAALAESAPGDKAVSHSCTTPSTFSASGLNPTSAPPTSASAVPVSPVPQSPIPPLLQDPNLLIQLLPALQATLQLNNSNVDISKINEVLTAAVTQASLQSIIHKFLTAFNITSLISQAAQLSTQAQPSNQSPMSLTSDASSPRSYVSPRISTPQTNTVPIKPLISTPPVSSQPKLKK
ncbi:WW domain-containing adapter protein with coiled-coil-like isoform X2 [Oryctolagus cuniculus]|uniref:WW domain-containing adapter protein with coiled-coil-like isoform X2 n=1 Tax=Oryctolagus cuniculus TaxID=9986 RepID=UPI0038795622